MKLEEFLKNSAIIVTLITAFFYCSSMVYTHAYLGRLGLDSDVLERSFHAVVYQGFIFNLQPMMIISMFIVGLVWIKAIVIIEFRRSVNNRRSNAKKIIHFKWKALKFLQIKKRALDDFERPLIREAINVSKIFLLLFFALLTLARFEIEGGKVANNVNQSITDQLKEKVGQNGLVPSVDILRTSIITPSLQKPDTALMFLYCGSRMCAGFDLVKEQVIYFPHTGFTYKQGLVAKPITD